MERSKPEITPGGAHRRATRGFTLVELLVVTAVLAIIMGIAVASLAGALDKARQGATIADMRDLATAIEAYQVDYSRPPLPGDFADVVPVLVPYYNRIVPVADHWGHQYTYQTDNSGSYSIISFGKDGVDGVDMTETTKGEFDRDIVLTDGEFTGLK